MNYLYGWLSIEPPVLVHSVNEDDIGRHLPEDPIIRFATYMWHSTTEQIASCHHRARALRPAHSLHHLVNDPTICRELVARGISAHFVSANAFLDERVFVIRPATERPFDAVYNARMAPFKRHALAANIPQLSIIGGVVAEDDRIDYFRDLLEVLPNATFAHASDARYRSSDEVAILLNQARVGLCLSACEGAMYASTEYLLCGLPVVSTVSKGGRDAWYDPRFTRIVPDNPAAVAAAVAELASLRIPPEFVRSETLCRMWEHRRRFLNLGQTIYAAHHVGREFARDFYTNFTNKMGDWRVPGEVMRWYEERKRRVATVPEDLN